MFKSTSKELGDIKAGTKQIIEFEYEDIIVVSMQSPCDCSVPSDRRKDKKIVVEYTPKPVPPHLIGIGQMFYPTSKDIVIEFTTPTDPKKQQVVLNFKGKVS